MPDFTIERLFEGRVFRVPDYQRGYAWETTQRTEFLEDLELLASGKSHYTGTVVLRDTGERTRSDDGRSYSITDVVDGQQRLTTFVILLDSIRRSLLALETTRSRTLGEGIERNYIRVPDLGGQPIFRLRLNRDSQDFFSRVVLGEPTAVQGPTILSHQLLLDTQRQFARYLTPDEASSESALIELFGKVTDHLKLTLYEVDEEADVGVIFEVMNNRGKPLSELEKVKNYLLYVSSKLDVPAVSLMEAVNHTWTDVFERLMAAQLPRASQEDELLRAHWRMAYDPQPRNWEGSKSIKGRFDLRRYPDHKVLLADLRRYTDGLRSSSLAYCDAQNPARQDAFADFTDQALKAEVVGASKRLTRVGNLAPFLPLLIAIRLKQPGDADSYKRVLDLAEVFAFRVYRLARRRADAGQGELFAAAHDLFNGKATVQEVLERMASTLTTYCSEREFELGLTEPGKDWYEWAGLKYFLYEYEQHLADVRGDAVQLPWEEVSRRDKEQSVEHILPQTPSDAYWRERFTDPEFAESVNDLGNLTLTGHNATYGNRSFPDKKGAAGQEQACYANSNLFMERELALYTDWTPDEVRTRRQALVDFAHNRWAVPVADTG